jgi:hypothetical protein
MLFGEILAVYSENRKKHMSALYEKSAELLNVESGWYI